MPPDINFVRQLEREVSDGEDPNVGRNGGGSSDRVEQGLCAGIGFLRLEVGNMARTKEPRIVCMKVPAGTYISSDHPAGGNKAVFISTTSPEDLAEELAMVDYDSKPNRVVACLPHARDTCIAVAELLDPNEAAKALKFGFRLVIKYDNSTAIYSDLDLDDVNFYIDLALERARNDKAGIPAIEMSFEPKETQDNKPPDEPMSFEPRDTR